MKQIPLTDETFFKKILKTFVKFNLEIAYSEIQPSFFFEKKQRKILRQKKNTKEHLRKKLYMWEQAT